MRKSEYVFQFYIDSEIFDNTSAIFLSAYATVYFYFYFYVFLWLGRSGEKENSMYYRNPIKIMYTVIRAFLLSHFPHLTLLVSPPAIEPLCHSVALFADPPMSTA
jgi:hypothetical protein